MSKDVNFIATGPCGPRIHLFLWTYGAPFLNGRKSRGFTGVSYHPLYHPSYTWVFGALVESISWFQVVELFPGLLETLREPVPLAILQEKLEWSSRVLEGVKDGTLYILIYPYMIHIYPIFTLRFRYLKLGLQKSETGLKGGLQWRFTYIFFRGVA